MHPHRCAYFVDEMSYVSCSAGLSKTKFSVSREMTLQQLELKVMEHMPHVPLGQFGFSFARAHKGRRIELFQGDTVAQLELFTRKGKLLIVPKRDLPVTQTEV